MSPPNFCLFVWLAVLGGLIPRTASSQESEVPVLTLEDTIALAFQHAPSLEQAEVDVIIAETRQLEVSLGRWLPSLSASSLWAPSGPIRGNPIHSTSGTDLEAVGDVFDDFGFQTNNSFRAVLPLYTFGRLSVADDLADVGYDVAVLQERKAELELAFAVRQAYFGLQLSKALQALVSDGRRRLDSARTNLENRLFDDPSARTELRRLTIHEASFVDRVADNRRLGTLARRGLQLMCGIEGDFEVEPFSDDLPEESFADLEAFAELAREHRPDIALLAAAVEAQELQAALERADMWPNIFFTLGFTFNYNPQADDQPSPFAPDPYNSRGLGLAIGLDWRFDFRQIAQARRADAELARMRARLEEAMGGIDIEIEQAWLDAQAQYERAVAFHDAFDASEAWLRQRTIQFDSNLASYEDLSTPLVAYFTAWGSYYQALFEYRLARANLALKVGLEELSTEAGLLDPEASDGASAPDEVAPE